LEKAKVTRDFSNAGFDAKGWNIGLYGMFGGDLGLYGGFLAKHDKANADASNHGAFAGVNNIDIKSTGIDAEAGYRFSLGGARIDLGGGLSWINAKIDDFNLAGITFDADKAKSLRGRLGGRIEGSGRLAPYFSASLLHEFRDDNHIAVRADGEADVLEAKGRGTWGRFEAGIGSHGRGGPMAALWGMIGDVKGFGVKAGWRFGGNANSHLSD